MRVIGGEYGSRIINMPKGVDIRPTQDRVREAIFNMLGDVTGKNVLDLFAGTGAFGIEAISRGARHASFIDINFKCIQTIRSNVDSLGLQGIYYDIIKGNAISIFPRLAKAEEKFDLIFIDPPYHRGLAKKCLINVDSYDILTQSGLVVIEHSKKDDLVSDLTTLILEKDRRYGDTAVTIFKKIV